MPAIFSKGDIFHTDGLRAYANGCDCAGSMDAGVSVAFKKKFPAMFDEYSQRCTEHRFKLGEVFTWTEGDETVYCLGIQQQSNEKPRAAALTKALTTMVGLAEAAGIEQVGLPRIAAGQTGLDWPRVKKILTEVGAQTSVTLVVFEQFIRSPNG
jgi:O-acetyl-ADP-ribose deacetylase (regulator of RNase III)